MSDNRKQAGYEGTHSIVGKLNEVIRRVNQLTPITGDRFIKINSQNSGVNVSIRLSNLMQAIGRAKAGGTAATLIGVTEDPGVSDIYYKVKKVVAGQLSGDEFWAFILTDPDHMGYPVRRFDHVYMADEMCFALSVVLDSSDGDPVWCIIGNHSYVGTGKSLTYDMTEKRLKAVFAATEEDSG